MLDPNKTQMAPGPSLNVTQTIQPVQCPVCKTFNPAGEGFCIECGLIFESALPDDVFGAPAVRPPCLVDSSGREHFLRRGKNLVGREGDVLLQDSRVSRKHAEVVLDNGRVSVTDLGSTNGTFVGGERLGEGVSVDLAEGDEVDFAGNVMTLSIPGAAHATKMIETEPVEKEEPVSDTFLLVGEERVALRLGANTIGRRPDNDIVIADPYASGSHGTLEVEDEGVFFTDLGSTNGTFINGAKMVANERVKVSAEDTLAIGQVEIRLTSEGEEE